MELVDGQPLSALLQPGQPLDPDATRDLLAQAADALGAAHAAGIVHRDVKPANLLVTPGRPVKITDFGIARAAEGMSLTETGQVMGTPQYLSPEQAQGGTATPASDVYSLGVVAFECLAGRRPFVAETAGRHRAGPPARAGPRAARRRPGRPGGRRPPGDGEVPRGPVRRRDRARRGPAEPRRRRGGSRPHPGAGRGRAGAGPATAPTAGPPRPRRPRSAAGRSPWLWILLGVLVVAAIVVVARWPAATRTSRTHPRPSERADEPDHRADRLDAGAAASPPPPTEDTTVQVDEADYVGRDVDEVADELQGPRAEGAQGRAGQPRGRGRELTWRVSIPPGRWRRATPSP